MNKFEQMCYLIVQRQKANVKRRQLLYQLNKKMKEFRMHSGHSGIYDWHHYKQMDFCKKELKAYRKQADAMRKLAVKVYSPLRRELKMVIKYNSSNNCKYIEYDKEIFSYNRVREIADGYLFDEIVLRDNKSIANPYEKLI